MCSSTRPPIAKGDFDEAVYVAVNDFQVNALEIEIDDDCTEILLRRQPAATDLRLVLSVSRTITDLERIGDEAEKIARLVLNLRGSGGISSYYLGMLSMGHHVRRMMASVSASISRSSCAILKAASESMRAKASSAARTMRRTWWPIDSMPR